MTNTYDSYQCDPLDQSCGMIDPNAYLHDSILDANYLYRGNVTESAAMDALHDYYYQTTGVPYVTAKNQKPVAVTLSDATSFSLPDSLSPFGDPNLTTSVSYAASWAVTSVSQASGSNSTTTYDSFGRPATSTIPDGAWTTYAYTYNPNTQTATLHSYANGPAVRWKTTTLDGFGRTTSVQTGYGSATVSIVDTQYAPCACSPLGKLWRVSQPYPQGGTPIWTTYAYDGSGRTLSVTAPDGSVTSYAYAGNQTTVTDPAGKWKTFTTDAFGNLTLVTEPNPGGGTVATNYAYDVLNHLTFVSMPGGAQTRAFLWCNATPGPSQTTCQQATGLSTGANMVRATNPENGTVTYYYNWDRTLSARQDAKGQWTSYGYDDYERPNAIYGPDRTVQYSYVSSGLGAGQVHTAYVAAIPSSGGVAAYTYAYNTSGRVASQYAAIVGPPYNGQSAWAGATTNYTWDYEGKLVSQGNPGFAVTGFGGPYQTFAYDQLGRLASTSTFDPVSNQFNTVATASYGLAGQMTSFWTAWAGTETRTYNSLLQLTGETVPGLKEMQYSYLAGFNNGRINMSTDGITGETVLYVYDSLQRLIEAETAQWGAGYTYDGFGNLTDKTALWGYVPPLQAVYDPATNWPVGGNYDANGNAPIGTWNSDNRLVAQTLNGQAVTWGYDSSGQRVMEYQVVNGQPQWTFWLYDIQGKRMAGVPSGPGCVPQSGNSVCTNQGVEVYFGSRLIMRGLTWAWQNGAWTIATQTPVVTDRLGSARAYQTNGTWTTLSYYPFGEEKTPVTPDGAGKFGTYIRDSTTPSQDYAMQRYYSANVGRFYSPDPGGVATANPRDPSTWNRYSYVSGDPVNSVDRRGLYTDDIDCLSNPDAPECTDPCAPMSEMMSLRRGMAMMLGPEPGCGPIALPDGGGDEAEEDSTAPRYRFTARRTSSQP